MTEQDSGTHSPSEAGREIKHRAQGGAKNRQQAAADQANRVTTGVGDRAGHAADGIGAMEESLRGKEDWLADAAGELRGSLSQLADTARNKGLGELKNDIEQIARERPALFMGAAIATGVALARVLRSSSQRSGEMPPTGPRSEAYPQAATTGAPRAPHADPGAPR